MTDNEIIKALECCAKNNVCNECPLARDSIEDCIECLAESAFDLINRQKAEIEMLQTTLFKKEDLMQMLREQKQAYYDELVSAKAKIERLDKLTIEQRREIDRLSDYVQYTRAEAIKEFAERLKDQFSNENNTDWISNLYFPKWTAQIDNLVKEMTEETTC